MKIFNLYSLLYIKSCLACATIYSIIYENYLLALMFGGFVIIDIGLIWDKHKKDNSSCL